MNNVTIIPNQTKSKAIVQNLSKKMPNWPISRSISCHWTIIFRQIRYGKKMKHVTSIENSLTSLGRLNHHLADEVAKLPDIRKFRTESSRLALSNLPNIYRFAPDGFDRMFKAIDKIGMLAYRKYCSPLQALL